jgi:hypothetical protein
MGKERREEKNQQGNDKSDLYAQGGAKFGDDPVKHGQGPFLENAIFANPLYLSDKKGRNIAKKSPDMHYFFMSIVIPECFYRGSRIINTAEFPLEPAPARLKPGQE